jgi:hypothetical protein
MQKYFLTGPMNNPRIALVRNYYHARWICLAQGGYYLVIGICFLISSFDGTAPVARGWWIAPSAGVLAVSGAIFLSAAKAQRVTAEIVALAMGETIALATAGMIAFWQLHPLSDVPVDAAVEAVFLAGWLVAIARRRVRYVRTEE